MNQKSTNWIGIILGVIWLLMAILIFVLYKTGSLSSTFKIPRMLSFVYQYLGIVWGSVFQAILSLLLIVSSLPKKK